MSPPNTPCPNCNKLIKSADVEKTIKCDGCQKPTHLSCVHLTQDDVNRFTRHSAKSIKIFCKNCIEEVDSINTLKSLILKLQTDLNFLKEQSTTNYVAYDDTFMDKVINEIEQRTSRKNNVIISGVLETETTSTELMQNVSNIVNKIAPGINLENTQISRLGRKLNNSSSRLIKIKFNPDNSQKAQQILRNAKKLREFPDCKNIYINYDRTPYQIQRYKQVKEELRTRLANGETDLRISYVNGSPSISQKN